MTSVARTRVLQAPRLKGRVSPDALAAAGLDEATCAARWYAYLNFFAVLGAGRDPRPGHGTPAGSASRCSAADVLAA